MIRLFSILCKCFKQLNNQNDYIVHTRYTAETDTLTLSCPECNAKGCFHSDGTYTRGLVCFSDDTITHHDVEIVRLYCTSCLHSHALLSPVIIPHSPFSFRFVISLLYDYVTHNYISVSLLCQKYDISISTLYRIFKRFLQDKKLMLGMMNDHITSSQHFLQDLVPLHIGDMISSLLMPFFKNQNYTFLQARCSIRLSKNST